MVDIPRTSPLVDTVSSPAMAFGRVVAALVAIGITLVLAVRVTNLDPTDEFYLDTTLGEVAVWVAEGTQQDDAVAWLILVAQARYAAAPDADAVAAQLLPATKNALAVWVYVAVALATAGGGALVSGAFDPKVPLAAAMLAVNALVFVFPPGALATWALGGVLVLGVTLLVFNDGSVPKVVGFFVVLSLLSVAWEGGKALAEALDYQVTAPAAGWDYTTYDTLDAALAALAGGEAAVVLADRNDLRDLIVEVGSDDDPQATAYPLLRYTTRFDRNETRWGRPLMPELRGRSALALPADAAASVTSIGAFRGTTLAVPAGDFSVESYLEVPRQVVWFDMGIANDLNLPHLQNIAEALLQPARRNGPRLLVSILYDAALYTWAEAAIGFTLGAALGFVLGSVFAHVALLQRSLLPYVIASQTIPIIAIAPMVVIWLRDSHPLLPVAVISAYLTFFPVTINTLRGLQSPDANAFNLMKSFAATRWQVMWKLRFPAALPFIFTALKISATASVVGAIIGELPSGIRNGLGRAILDFSSDYSLISTPKLWAAIFMSALLGITFFLIVAGVERLVLRGR